MELTLQLELGEIVVVGADFVDTVEPVVQHARPTSDL